MKKVARFALVACLGYSPFCLAEGERATIGAGNLGVFDSTNYGAVALSAEGGEIAGLWSVRPTFEVIYQPDNTYYAGIGGLKEFAISERWSWGLGAAAGYYHRGEGKDIGQALEFYSRIVLSYHMAADSQIRTELGHISNAKLDDTNPGTEFLSVNWVFTF